MEPIEIEVIAMTDVVEKRLDATEPFPFVGIKFKNIPAFLYMEQCELKPGDRVKITITKEPDDAN